LRQIISALIKNGVNPKNTFYLNKELIEFDDIKTHKQLFDLVNLYKKNLKVKGKTYLFFDEIQEISQWEKTVNSLSQNHKEECEIFITGSNSKMLSSELATYLSGRYVAFEIFPFSFNEFTASRNLPKNKESFLLYMKTGGLPELLNLPDEETKSHYISSLKDTIMLRDIVERRGIKDVQLLENTFKFIADNIGSLFSTNAIVNYLESHQVKTNHETISNYVQYLVQSFLAHCAERYDIKGKEIFSAGKKYYLNDLAFKNYFSSSFSYGLGKQLENIIYLHYRRLGYSVYVGSISGEEVDFVLEKDGEKKYIQVAYTLSNKKTADREFRSLEKIKDSFEKAIISLDDAPLGNKNGIRHICAWELE
jgi:predicted AAA+ superfamily ATPase